MARTSPSTSSGIPQGPELPSPSLWPSACASPLSPDTPAGQFGDGRVSSPGPGPDCWARALPGEALSAEAPAQAAGQQRAGTAARGRGRRVLTVAAGGGGGNHDRSLKVRLSPPER